jgi:hypothetical protein
MLFVCSIARLLMMLKAFSECRRFRVCFVRLVRVARELSVCGYKQLMAGPSADAPGRKPTNCAQKCEVPREKPPSHSDKQKKTRSGAEPQTLLGQYRKRVCENA